MSATSEFVPFPMVPERVKSVPPVRESVPHHYELFVRALGCVGAVGGVPWSEFLAGFVLGDGGYGVPRLRMTVLRTLMLRSG